MDLQEDTQEGDAKAQLLAEAFHKEGLDAGYWLPKASQILGIKCREALQHLEYEDYLRLECEVQHPWEKRALQKLLKIKDDKMTTKEVQKEHLEKTKQRQEVAKKALKDLTEMLKSRSHSQDALREKAETLWRAMEIPKEFWPQPKNPLVDMLESIQKQLEQQELSAGRKENIPDTEVLRRASGGLALQGIYRTSRAEDVLAKREQLLRVPEGFQLTSPEQGSLLERKEFSPSAAESTFTKSMQQLGFSMSVSAKSSFWGINLGAGVDHTSSTQSQNTHQSHSEQSYFCTTRYQYIPLASCYFQRHQLRLSDAALRELQDMEQSLNFSQEEDNPTLVKMCESFFSRFGSHINQGPLHFGGIFWWKASTEGFRAEQREEMKRLTSEALNSFVRKSYGDFLASAGGALHVSNSRSKASIQGRTGESSHAAIQLYVVSTGGPADTASLPQWKTGLVSDNTTWCVIDRGFELIPVWDVILCNHCRACLDDKWEEERTQNILSDLEDTLPKPEAPSQSQSKSDSRESRENEAIANQEFLQLLKRLGLESHYPRKMGMGDFRTICKTSLQDSQPSQDKELPLYFLQKLLTVDYRVRYLTCLDDSNPGLAPMPQTREQDNQQSDSFENFLDKLMEAGPKHASRDGHVHPMDLQMAIEQPKTCSPAKIHTFMQLIPVGKELQQDLGFDFVLVVDTEGLRAIEMANKQSLNHDNELATFVIGVGNVTVINIFGENPSEMQDVLQIAVQAFLRMKKVNLSPSCVFVHQNVGEATAKEQNMEGQRRLQEKLDEMTVVAAQQEFCDVSSFSDVIAFDVNTHIHYFAHLWEGNPPMAPPNPTYSQNVQQLKSKILQAAKNQSQCSILRLSSLKDRIGDLWNALLNENFVFSFKNSLEIEQENFEYFKQYLTSPKQFCESYIEIRVRNYCLEGTRRLGMFLDSSLNLLYRNILSVVSSSTQIVKDRKDREDKVSLWLDEFCRQLTEVINLPRSDLKGIEHQEVTDIEFLSSAMAEALDDLRHRLMKELSEADLSLFPRQPHTILVEHFSGCWEQCPFCGAVCTNTMRNHDGDHQLVFHRPEALMGWRKYGTDELVIDICSSRVASDISFILHDGRKFPYKRYRDAGPPFSTWNILPDSSMQAYWKWFVSHFKTQLEALYNGRFHGRGEIPEAWQRITKEEALSELEKR
ncbi:LOW QUALITY PROTEIN: interferon-induced very large GTPase 1-like [Pyrgilauda ruficollis]|uniref:LOW QUALITY PROTEIN: interferon-induced very large GTPase 1-like n=1 Tax=Pyrgilauda ruficollis TaxID=221976 RepID=UPI001B87D15D|nr:LOW QUALITY PROTEIN: interferon-induced very large GTPase 1-like [Pyrgilauda ruficollis]